MKFQNVGDDGAFLASVSFKYSFLITIGSLRTVSSWVDLVRIDPGVFLWFCQSPGPRIPQMTPQLAPSAYELTGSAWRENSRTKTPYTWRWGYFVWITPSAFPDENWNEKYFLKTSACKISIFRLWTNCSSLTINYYIHLLPSTPPVVIVDLDIKGY